MVATRVTFSILLMTPGHRPGVSRADVHSVAAGSAALSRETTAGATIYWLTNSGTVEPMRHARKRHGHDVRFAPLSCLVVGVAGCIPYTVGTTAQPAPLGESVPTMIWYSIPNGFEDMRDSSGGLSFTGIDAEGRRGVSERADVGLRVPSGTGLVVSYKYRLTPGPDRTAPAVAVMGGTGLVNLGNHAYVDLTLLASGRQATLTPYGGLRVSQVLPLSRDAVHDSPTAGGFLGLRVGRETMGVSAEVGMYYDRSALGLRSSNVIVVPALVIHGSELIALIGRAWRDRSTSEESP